MVSMVPDVSESTVAWSTPSTGPTNTSKKAPLNGVPHHYATPLTRRGLVFLGWAATAGSFARASTACHTSLSPRRSPAILCSRSAPLGSKRWEALGWAVWETCTFHCGRGLQAATCPRHNPSHRHFEQRDWRCQWPGNVLRDRAAPAPPVDGRAHVKVSQVAAEGNEICIRTGSSLIAFGQRRPANQPHACDKVACKVP